VSLVREGAVIPHIRLAQSTAQKDWSQLELAVFGETPANAEALVCLPSDDALRTVAVAAHAGGLAVARDPFGGKVRFTVRRGPPTR
jgi:alpha-D-xyloside xylohydrolase